MVEGYKFVYKSMRQLKDGSVVKYYSCIEEKCDVRCRLLYNTEGVRIKTEVRSCHEHATKEYPISSQAMREVINGLLDSPSGWSDNSSMLYGLLQNEFQCNNNGQIKSRVSSVKHFIRVVKKRYFMSYDIMADEMLRDLFVPFDPMDERNLLSSDIVILCKRKR